MKLVAVFFLSCSFTAWAGPCDSLQTDILIIGDSQTGAAWGRNYYGNYLQQCLSAKGLNFAIYGRGATQPIHWLSNAGLDHIDLIQRGPTANHQNIGHGASVPNCKQRLPAMLRAHAPQKFIAFFGDNLLGVSEATITAQVSRMVDEVNRAGIPLEHCYFLTPTYEMAVTSRRNVPYKTIEATASVTAVVANALRGKCRHLSGIALMTPSPLLQGNLLSRVQDTGQLDCFGPSGNDNLHLCGHAARELAQHVCEAL